MTQDEFLAAMQEDVLDTERPILPETKLKDIEEWDSLAYVTFIAFANTNCGITLDRARVQQADTIGNLYELLKE